MKTAKTCTPKLWQQRSNYVNRQPIKTAKTCTPNRYALLKKRPCILTRAQTTKGTKPVVYFRFSRGKADCESTVTLLPKKFPITIYIRELYLK